MSGGRFGASFGMAARTAADLITGDFITAVGRGVAGSASAPRVSVSIMGVPLLDFAELKAKRTFDERIKRLDDAREALVEGIEAISALSNEAQAVKEDHARIVAELKEVTESKADTEKKLAEIKAITNREVAAFQTLAGVTDVRRERLIGFASGIAASTVATALWLLGSWVLKTV